jgi:hypothetical protein
MQRGGSKRLQRVALAPQSLTGSYNTKYLVQRNMDFGALQQTGVWTIGYVRNAYHRLRLHL